MSKNGTENVVEFVCDATSESTDRFQLLCLMQLHLPVPERSCVGPQPHEQVRDINREKHRRAVEQDTNDIGPRYGASVSIEVDFLSGPYPL